MGHRFAICRLGLFLSFANKKKFIKWQIDALCLFVFSLLFGPKLLSYNSNTLYLMQTL